MMLMANTGGWSLYFLVAVIPGVLLQTDNSSIQPSPNFELPSETHIDQPVLHHSESVPPIGTYMLKNHVGKPCIKATMGAEYIVTEKKMTWYFNLDPSRVRIDGNCSKEAAVLSLTLPDRAANLQFNFRKENSFFSVTELTAQISPLPVCQRCANKTYSGLLADDKLFTAAIGQSFRCKSENLLEMSSELKIKLVPLQMQAFTLPEGRYGEEVECWVDINKQVIPVIVGAIVVGLILIAVLTFLVIKDRRRGGYDRL
ncbi:lysosome-associated membrane glycoprotein 3 [Plectropomus leopardus]|uniref:lysosome-associated membrane glycoprotein 3 n=1 Tax=Plectropomus leopardus TaxID=160734 RepID=UPI001C4AC8A9|nr:lysosome-associated membrane glycoprotein 3 [Plectropomus leopardus]